MLLGCHLSIKGGFENAFIEAQKLGIDTFQIFTKNQYLWRAKTITLAEAEVFKKHLRDSNIKIAFSHNQYLVNLASSDSVIREKSILELQGELLRCSALGLSYTVLHPGSAKNSTESQAIINIAKAINLALKNSGDLKVKILLENTAGQGTSIGWKLDHISQILERVNSKRMGFCFDTCHAFAAGYDIRTKQGFEATMEDVDKKIGIKQLLAIHLNDSKGLLGSRIDRHEHIGKGQIGLIPFELIMKHFQKIPKILETKKEGGMLVKNLEILRHLSSA